jgi:O-antigen/teichoic acid export membrane protein
MLSGNGLKLVIQAVYFVLIARSLEPTQYGGFVAVVAIAAIVSPFVGLGTSNLIIRNVAHDKSTFAMSWGNGLLVTAVSGLLALALVLSCTFLLPAHLHWMVLLLVAVSDLLFGRLTDFCGFAFAAYERFGANAQLNVWSSLTRLIGLGVLTLIVHHPNIEQWSFTYLIATFITAAISVGWGLKALGKPVFKVRAIWPEMGEGIFFSIGLSAQSIYNDIDKTMLAKLGDLSSTGIYGAAYRIIDVSIVPIRSILSAANPGFFRAGKGGMKDSVDYMRKLLPKSIAYSVFVLVALLLCAPLVPHVLGKDYARTVGALRWLSLLPLLKTIHSFFADAMTGAGFQKLRTIIQIFVAVFNILINLWIIPAYSWRGAAWSSIAGDAALVVLFSIAINSLLRKQRAAQPILQEVTQ